MKPLVIVTTLLSGEGPTGVETHFNQVMRDVVARGGEACLINPYTGSRWRRAVFRPLKNLRHERAAVLYRRGQAHVLKEQIRARLAQNSGREITIYAQCPLSAQAALIGRENDQARVLMVVHYNLSESEEVVNKGLAQPGGPWTSELTRIEAETLPRLDGIVFGCDFMKRTVNGRVRAIRNLPQEIIFNFAPVPTAKVDAGAPAGDLIAIGTLEPRKNQAFLLHVLAAARELGQRYSLTLIGDGPDRVPLERLVDKLALRDQVNFAGFRPDGSQLISNHRALVHAAKLENCPLIIAEALAAGRPILAAPVGGIPEMFHDGVEGSFWNLADPRGAAKLLADLLNDPVRYSTAAAAARTRYDTAFAGLRDRWVDFLAPSLARKAPA